VKELEEDVVRSRQDLGRRGHDVEGDGSREGRGSLRHQSGG
jgi:hypothetical protein